MRLRRQLHCYSLGDTTMRFEAYRLQAEFLVGRVINSDDPGKEISQTCKPERHRRGRLREIDHPVWENGEAVKAVPLRFVE